MYYYFIRDPIKRCQLYHKLSIPDAELNKGEEREQWKDPVQFFMTFLGYCVGLGNIWRFPYLCQQNGGGKLKLTYLGFLTKYVL
jgi:solute carrier family 6 (neurotransmitter transporter) protein 19